MARRWLAVACAVAGVAVLTGPGWALLVAAALIAVTPTAPTPRVGAVVARVRAGARGAWSWLVGRWRWLVADRQRLAALMMPLAVVAVGLGLADAVGVGWGVAAAGVIVGSLSLAADRAA